MDAPAQADALSLILNDMRLSGGVFLDAEFTAPWAIVSEVEAEDCQPFMDMPPYLIAYHYVVEGELVAEVGDESLRAGSGQLLLLPRNEPHLLASDPEIKPANAGELIDRGAPGEIARIRHGGGGNLCRMLCGFLGSETGHDPLLLSLPAMLLLNLDDNRTGRWVEESIRYLMRGLARGGASAAANLNRLAELLLAEAIGEYARQQPADEHGWLNGLRDPVVGKALALLHTQADRRWTLQELAREVASSRSVLTDRFTRLLGLGPMAYHRGRRLTNAARQLAETDKPVNVIAFEAGYGSEAAFSRTFKKNYGSSPAAFRKSSTKSAG